MVQAPAHVMAEAGPSRLHHQKTRAPSYTSSPLRSSSSSRETYNGSDSESDRSEPIAIPGRMSTSPSFARPATFTPASQAGTSWIPKGEALDAPLQASPPSPVAALTPRTPPSASMKSRRRSSASLLDITAASPARSSLVGSYEQSLLSGRMSSLPSRPLPFQAELGVLGGGKGKGKMPKLPPHVNVDFGAVFYGEAASSPYVGAIDLEQHYLDELLAARMHAVELDDDEAPASLPRFPGYRLPSETGQIQLVIKNPNKTPVKLFLVPYDLTDLKPGQKTFIRQKLYLDNGKGPLQYAVHLPFCSPPRTHGSSRKGNVRIYLHGTIRVVFHAGSVSGASNKLHILYDQPAPSDGYAGPSEDWLEARQLAASPASLPQPFDPDGADASQEDMAAAELVFARRSVTPSVGSGYSGLSGSRPGTPLVEEPVEALR